MSAGKIVKTSILTAIILLLLTPFAGSPTLLDTPHNERFFYFAGISIAVWLFAAIGLLIKSARLKLAFNLIDIFVVLFLVYSVARFIFTPFASFLNFQFLTQLFLTFLYFMARRLSTPPASWAGNRSVQLLLAGFLAVGLFQAVVGLMQFYGFAPSNSFFKVIGTFGNPNHYAAYLISVLPLAFGMYLFFGEDTKPGLRLLKYLGAVTAMIIILVLPGTHTRAAWLAGGVGMGFVLAIKYDVFIKTRKKLKRPWQFAAALAAVLAVLMPIGGALFQLKPDSAAGRLFIWKVTGNMIREQPLFGIGYERFAVDYDHYQAAFFQSGTGSGEEKQLAQHTKHAHNDFLQIFAETGLVGFLLFSGIVLSALLSGIKGWTNPVRKERLPALRICAQASLLALLVNSMLFFPLKMLEVQLHFYLLLAFISAASNRKPLAQINLPPVMQKAAGVALLTLSIALGYKVFQLKSAYNNWQSAAAYAALRNPGSTLQMCEDIYPLLHHNGEFLFFYGGLLYKAQKYQEARQIFTESRCRFTDPNLEILLAQVYQKLGDLEPAEAHLRTAMNMVPHKFHARYLLAEQYAEHGDTAKAINLAREILDMAVKVPSTAVEEIKEKAQQMLVSMETQREREAHEILQKITKNSSK